MFERSKKLQTNSFETTLQTNLGRGFLANSDRVFCVICCSNIPMILLSPTADVV